MDRRLRGQWNRTEHAGRIERSAVGRIRSSHDEGSAFPHPGACAEVPMERGASEYLEASKLEIMSTEWENRYQKGETPWEKGEAHPALISFLRRTPVAGRGLVPGCGSGHDVRALAATADE